MIQLWDVDLNLLVVLEVLLRTQSVTRAAEVLHRTPSAVSHALGRLRGLFDDELLVRDGRRMRPTARGLALQDTLPRVLEQLQRTLAAPAAFDPATSARTFRIAAPDFVATVLADLVQRFETQAPRAAVMLAGIEESSRRDLAEGRFDAMVLPAGFADEGLRERPLGGSSWRVYARRGHPAFAAWTVDAWRRHPHLRVQTTAVAERGPVDHAIDALGIARRVGAVVPHFAMAPSVLARTDQLLTVPAVAIDDRIADALLDHRDVPFDLEPMQLSLYRSAVSGDLPEIRWFAGHVIDAMHAELDADAPR